MKFYATFALVALAAVLSACGETQHTLSATEQATAELGALQYASAVQADVAGKPSGLDSDNDGYVTATLKDRGTGKTFAVVCSYRGGAGGCKQK